MEVWAALLVVIVELLFSGTLLARLAPAGTGAGLEQHAAGGCSPPVVGDAGDVAIACPGVEGKPLQYLQKQLTETLRQQLHGLGAPARPVGSLAERIDDLRDQADLWSQRYRALSARLGNTPPWRAARALIAHGEFERAEAIFRQLAAGQEEEAESAAETQYSLGDLAMLRFNLADALPHYEAAFDTAPDNPLFASGYAGAAYRDHDYFAAERGLTAALRRYRNLALRDPATYRPSLAMTLNNLGLLYHDTGRPAEAGQASAEAQAIWRQLAAENPQIYGAMVGTLTTGPAALPWPGRTDQE